MPHYVYSTMTENTKYGKWKYAKGCLPVLTGHVHIKGGANKKAEGDRLYTPRGAVNVVSDEDMEFLLNDFHFLTHKEKGFVTHEKQDGAPNLDKAADNMSARDGSSPRNAKQVEEIKEKYAKKKLDD